MPRSGGWSREPRGLRVLVPACPLGPRWYEVAPDRCAVRGPTPWRPTTGPGPWRRAPSEARVLLVTSGNSFLERILSIQGSLRTFKSAPSDWAGLLAAQGALPTHRAGPPLAGPHARGQRCSWWVHPWGRSSAPSRCGRGPITLCCATWTGPRCALPEPIDFSRRQLGEGDRLRRRAASGRSHGGRGDVRRSSPSSLAISDLPLRPAFPVLMANLLDWLLPAARGGAANGGTRLCSVSRAGPLAEQLRVEDSEGTRHELAPPWPPRPFRPPAPGLYRVIQEGGSGRQESSLIAAPYDAGEADLTPRSVEIPAGRRGRCSSRARLLSLLALAGRCSSAGIDDRVVGGRPWPLSWRTPCGSWRCRSWPPSSSRPGGPGGPLPAGRAGRRCGRRLAASPCAWPGSAWSSSPSRV